MEINIGDRVAEVNILESDKNLLKVEVDGKTYELDYVIIGTVNYSFIYMGKSLEMEITAKDKPKAFEVLHDCLVFDTEVVDAEARYMKNRKQGDVEDDENIISSPMPGKVVKVLVKEGEEVKAGQTLIIISAMKMESEYKAHHDGLVRKVLTEEGATIDGNQPLIVIE